MYRHRDSDPARGWRRWAYATAVLGCSLAAGACSDLLEVELPAQLSDEAVNDPRSAQTLINSIIGQYEAAWSDHVYGLHAREDGCETGVQSPGVVSCEYLPTLPEVNAVFVFTRFQIARNFAYQLHDKLENDWTVQQVPQRARFLAITSLYAGAVVGTLAESHCELTIDGGELMTPDAGLAVADQWLTKAIGEIQTAGDFTLPYAAASARATAYGLRARVRWMKGDKTGALADAQQVPPGFRAWVTRETGSLLRRNLTAHHGPLIRYSLLYGVVDWWKGPNNPVTGTPWPAVIPFTGYQELGILPDGRAVRDDGLPIRVAGLHRTPVESTAVRDTRVPFVKGAIQGVSGEKYLQAKYTTEDQDLPWVNWKEMWLIRAEIEGGQKAIDLVNEVRAADNLPLVSYITGATATPAQIRYMVIEERRRALFVEGRFYATKLKNLDILWFPRAAGAQLEKGQTYGGAVRHLMPENEYLLNPNLGLAKRATGCPANERPLNF